jgi:heterodisulfide reductase subunit A2
LDLSHKRILIIGSGIAGLTSAVELKRFGCEIHIMEKSNRMGGHAAEYSCKAIDKCVKCGACQINQLVDQVTHAPEIQIFTASSISNISKPDRYIVNMGSNQHTPREYDAILMATGFTPFDPVDKPYGYKKFPNVITNLALEKMLKQMGKAICLSDRKEARKIAFIQCVGSRDRKHGNPWCSQVCCASALRMARLIKHRQKDTNLTFFYIDVQTFGRDFEQIYENIKEDIRMIRAIPGDIFQSEKGHLSITWFNQQENKEQEEVFDMVVLSVGMTPNYNLDGFTELIQKKPDSGPVHFLSTAQQKELNQDGIFTAGTINGPMNILQTQTDARSKAWEVYEYLQQS